MVYIDVLLFIWAYGDRLYAVETVGIKGEDIGQYLARLPELLYESSQVMFKLNALGFTSSGDQKQSCLAAMGSFDADH